MTVQDVVISRKIDYDSEELKRQVAAGLTLTQLAANFGVCTETIRKWKKAQGCRFRTPRRLTPEILKAFEDLYKQGYTDAKIAQETTHNYQTVIFWRTARGYPKNKKPTRIIFEKMYSEGCKNYIALAEATGLAESTMRMWINKEIKKEAKASENPWKYYRKARAELIRLNSNGANQGALKCDPK